MLSAMVRIVPLKGPQGGAAGLKEVAFMDGPSVIEGVFLKWIVGPHQSSQSQFPGS
jgi:hypothetical protein